MSFDYFYGQQSDLFTFYRVPKVLFTNERFWNISADAKMLYGILLDRMSLSAKNGWIDKNGRVYIIFTIDEAKMALNCAEQKATLICTYGDSLDGALIYLENFAPDEARERFEERIRSLFETKWIIELVDMAMLKIREYPDKGALYCEIISKAYLNRFKYRESEMLEVLNMERSSYYDRKKEAILLFGLSLWGTAIPKLKDFLESAREEEALCYCEC